MEKRKLRGKLFYNTSDRMFKYKLAKVERSIEVSDILVFDNDSYNTDIENKILDEIDSGDDLINQIKKAINSRVNKKVFFMVVTYKSKNYVSE